MITFTRTYYAVSAAYQLELEVNNNRTILQQINHLSIFSHDRNLTRNNQRLNLSPDSVMSKSKLLKTIKSCRHSSLTDLVEVVGKRSWRVVINTLTTTTEDNKSCVTVTLKYFSKKLWYTA